MHKGVVFFTVVAMVIAALPAAATDVTGTWSCTVQLDSGTGTPTFVFKQEGEKLTGTYNGPLGEYKVTGTMTGAKAVFGFDFTQDGVTGKATYTGTIESPTKMTGTVEFTGGERGKWAATKKQ